jgi:hypothetical protein
MIKRHSDVILEITAHDPNTVENDLKAAVEIAREQAWECRHQLGGPIRRQGLFPSLVRAALLGQGDAFPLAFPDKGTFEFREGTHDREHEVHL